jgi:type IV pilus assembly protein PilX
VVLFVLIITSLLGVGATQIAMMSERAARSDRDQQIALQAAEAALADAELDIFNTRRSLFSPPNPSLFLAGCGSSGDSLGLCSAPTTGTKPAWLTANLDADTSNNTIAFGNFTGQAFAAANGGVGPVRKPRYIIEILRDPIGDESKTMYLYRITAIGFGPRADIQAVLQTIFRL